MSAHETVRETMRTMLTSVLRARRSTYGYRRGIVALAAAGAFAVGCSGDVGPLGEAIEVADLRLASLSIPRPAGTLTPLTVNAGERLSLTLAGVDVDGRNIEVPAGGRNWRVSDDTVASIDGNGELVALRDGAVTIGVSVGDVVAGPFDVRVSTRPLSSIERIVGADALDPCLVESYTAIGVFGGDENDERLLSGVDWSAAAPGTELRPDENRSVTTLSAARPGTVELVATVDDASFGRSIEVNDTLQSLVVTPEGLLSAEQDATLELTATATYGDGGDDDARVARDVTESVTWENVSGAERATVSNAAGSRGEVATTDVAGVAEVRAACGDVVSDPRQITVRDTSTSTAAGSDALSFEAANGVNGLGSGSSRSISVGAQVQFRVSTGSTYDASRDVTDEAEWTLRDVGDGLIGTLGTGGFQNGLFEATQAGRGEIRAIFDNRVITLNITVN